MTTRIQNPEGLTRRSFIKLAATAGVAAAIPGCEPVARKLIPYVVPDENVIPGVPTYYATICNECPAGCGVIAKVREGRVVKLEGNPLDPIGRGSLCARGQAALQGLYNPDRLPHPEQRGSDGKLAPLGWEQAIASLTERLSAASARGHDRVAFIGAPQGPTIGKIIESWLSAWGSGRLLWYEALSEEAAR